MIGNITCRVHIGLNENGSYDVQVIGESGQLYVEKHLVIGATEDFDPAPEIFNVISILAKRISKNMEYMNSMKEDHAEYVGN